MIIGAFIFPKSKIINLLLLIIIFALFSLSYDDYDYLNYLSAYNNYIADGESIFEPLYRIIMLIAGRFNLEFDQFRYFTSLVFVVSLDLFFIKLSSKPNCILALYLIYSSFYDAPLIRNSLAMCIAIWGIYELIQIKSATGYLKCLAIFSVASLFHGSYWILLFLVAIYGLLEKRMFRIVGVSLITLFIICFSFQDILFNVFSHFISKTDAYEEYYTGANLNLFGVIVIVMKFLFIISPIWFFPPKRTIENDSHALVSLENKIIYIDIAFILIFILQVVAPSYSRLLRLLILVNYIYIINYPTKNKAIKYAFGLSYAIGMLLLAFLWERPETLQTIIYMHFDTNILFKLLS